MGSIVLLDEHTINKIAAGEVVDRPSSIVKELVENSIDAGATSITVEIKNGGIKYIKVVDNGKGFASDDVEIAFERHATSKIRKEEDLLKITSMGFRGEALASIAAISKVDLVTMNKEENIGTHARVEAGEIIVLEPAPSTIGTKIEIRDVFYNVPARFKFLKKDYTEAGYIEDVIIRAALANPSINFKFINNGKTIIQTTGNTDLKSTIYDIFGKEVYNNIIEINDKIGDIIFTGMLGMPSISRSTRLHQYTFINKRYIKDKTISSAIDRACEQKYTINKHPFLVLDMGINPSHIDVNVHPAKLEVKFDDESKIFNAVYTAIRNAIEKNNREISPFTQNRIFDEENKINQISKDIKNNGMLSNYSDNTQKKFDFELASKKIDVGNDNENKNDDKNNLDIKINEDKPDIPNLENKLSVNEDSDLIYDTVVEDAYIKKLDITYKETPSGVTKSNIDLLSNNSSNGFKFENLEEQGYDEIDVIPKEQIKPYTYVGHIFNTYIIIQMDNKMYLIDQHAAHERYLFEQIKKSYYSKDKETQMLLIPILVELTSKEKNIVDENKEMFEKSGFIIDDFGENTVKICGVPNIGYEIEYQSMFKDLIDELLGTSKTDKDEKEFRFLATVACKAAVKGNMNLDVKEQLRLVDNMMNLENPYTCPHGRPTAFEMSRYEIERKFFRK